MLRVEQLESRLLLSANPVLQQTALGTTAGTAITLGAMADAYVSGNTPFTNFGNANDLLIQNSTTSRTSNDSKL
jgi:hypothetical protein